MRSNQQVAQQVQLRIGELRAKSAQRQRKLYTISAVAACLVLIVGLAAMLPGIAPQISTEAPGLYNATLIADGRVGGYVLMGVIGVVLGVVLTLLCINIAKKDKAHNE